VDIVADQIALRETGDIELGGAAVVRVAAPGGVHLGGAMFMGGLSAVDFSGPLHNAGTFRMHAQALAVAPAISNSGIIAVFGGILSAPHVTNFAEGGTLYGFGDVFGDIVNGGVTTIITDTRVHGDYENNGTTIIQHGVLSVSGTLLNNGVLIGDVTRGSAGADVPTIPVDGVFAHGDYVSGEASTLRLAEQLHLIKVGGSFDVRINDSDRFDLSRATLQLPGLPGGEPQSVELMAQNAGNHVSLPAPALYSIGVVRVGPTPTTVVLVDQHDNTAEGEGDESLYVGHLRLDPGVTLDLAGLVIYYVEITPTDPFAPDSGVTVIDSVGGGDLIRISGATAPGDIDGDGDVDLDDYGDVDLDDYAVFPDCMAGPDNVPSPPPDGPTIEQCLGAFDFDRDVDVDKMDFRGFQRVFTGPL
jgi:hypothetical protein